MQPKPDILPCPDCGDDVEIWSDEAVGKCPSCSRTVIRTETQSCVDWCKYAKECLGDDKFRQYGQMKAEMRKPVLLKAVQDYFGDDSKRFNHAAKVVTYAEAILAEEDTADPNIVIAAAALHDIGIKNAEEKHDSSSAKHQETEGPPVARSILIEIGYPEHFIKEVCDIIAHHHHPRDEETINFKVLFDSDLIVNIEEEDVKVDKENQPPTVLDRFFTVKGRQIAKEVIRNL